MKYNNIAQTLKSNGRYASPIGEGERAITLIDTKKGEGKADACVIA